MDSSVEKRPSTNVSFAVFHEQVVRVLSLSLSACDELIHVKMIQTADFGTSVGVLYLLSSGNFYSSYFP